ncbi:hypothetical protein [Streptomyces tremellae]|uniref:Uncharacterized protein n=1 Tax=Streptomyces tremellae TaxID=1124239 RepID=A0ABP7EPD6_9ACTN
MAAADQYGRQTHRAAAHDRYPDRVAAQGDPVHVSRWAAGHATAPLTPGRG